MKQLFILLSALTFTSMLAAEQSTYCPPYQYQELIQQINDEMAADLCKRYQLRASNISGVHSHAMKSFFVDFETNKNLDQDAARALLVNCREYIQTKLNSIPAIRPYLFEYPFPIVKVDISIFTPYKLKNRTIAYVSTRGDKIAYALATPAGIFQQHGSPDDLRESYEEALAIVRKQGKLEMVPIAAQQFTPNTQPLKEKRAAIQRNKATTKDYIYEKYHSRPDTALDTMLDSYGEEIAEKQNLLFLYNYIFTTDMGHYLYDMHYGLAFQSDRETTLDEARPFIQARMKEFIEKLRSDPVVKEQHAKMNKDFQRRKYPPAITKQPEPFQVGWKLGFWDQNGERPKPPYIAEIHFKEGAFHYYLADTQTSALTLLLYEPYEDAIAEKND